MFLECLLVCWIFEFSSFNPHQCITTQTIRPPFLRQRNASQRSSKLSIPKSHNSKCRADLEPTSTQSQSPCLFLYLTLTPRYLPISSVKFTSESSYHFSEELELKDYGFLRFRFRQGILCSTCWWLTCKRIILLRVPSGILRENVESKAAWDLH